MSKASHYRQCVLTRSIGSTQVQLTTWLEEPKVAKDKKVHIKDDPNHPEDEVWTIASVGNRATAEWVSDHRKAHERWRKVTDV